MNSNWGRRYPGSGGILFPKASNANPESKTKSAGQAAREKRINSLRRKIILIQAELEAENLSSEKRAELMAALEKRKRSFAEAIRTTLNRKEK